MKSITIKAKTDKALAARLFDEARRITIIQAGGNWELDRAMRAAGLSDEDLSRKIGLTANAVYYWRMGLRYPTPRSIGLICEALKCKPENIGFGKDGGK